MNSLTLLELLRRRSALPVEEIRRLLNGLPALLNDAERQGDLPTARLLNAVQVIFATGADEEYGGRSVSEWPAFRLELIADATQSETAVTVEPQVDARFSHDLPARFAALLYELLGGPHRSDGARPPLSALGEAANRMLQRALAGGAFADCADFWREFLRASSPAQRVVRIPASLLGSGTPGLVLTLIPHDDGARIRLVGRSQFRIGRSRAAADLLTRFQPETPENAARTHELGRVHVLGEIIDGEPMLRDGNGFGPSANGSTFDGHPLGPFSPMPVRQRAVLDLAGRFAFGVIPQLAASEEFIIENLAARSGGREERKFGASRDVIDGDSHFDRLKALSLSKGNVAAPCALRGAIVFEAGAGQPFARDAVWLFTRIDFALGQDDRPIWLPPARNNPAAFLHLGDCFWIVNFGLLPGHVRIGENSLARGEAARLGAGAVLEMGSRVFSIEVK